jgi:aspartyl-tRNA(Asn)/glutamyl-tRNA(Gln) amidotransferase subunit A
MPLSWSNDHLGPMARTALDCALMLQAMAGADSLDATTSSLPVDDYVASLEIPVRGLRVGVPLDFFFQGLDTQMEAGVRGAVATLATLGARVAEIRLPDPRVLNDITGLISRSESSALHGRLLRERPQELDAFTRARLELGLGVPAYDYLQALRLRARLARAFTREVWSEVDVLAVPVIPEPAPPLRAALEGLLEERIARQGRFSRLTRPFNGLGLPALSLPCGFSAAGLPLAFQLVGRPFDEATVLRVGHAYQRATDWHTREPDLGAV